MCCRCSRRLQVIIDHFTAWLRGYILATPLTFYVLQQGALFSGLRFILLLLPLEDLFIYYVLSIIYHCIALTMFFIYKIL